MLNLKSRLVKEIIDPQASNRSSTVILGKVLEVTEEANLCAIKFTDHNGVLKKEAGVHIQLYNKHILDWFPKVGDTVTVSSSQGNFTVTGPAYNNGYGSIRTSLKLKEDVLSSTFNDFIGGAIF